MRHLVCATLLLTLAQAALANSVSTYNVSGSMGIAPNFGSGGNMSFFASGPNISLTGDGGTGCFWCTTNEFLPGQSVSASIFFVGIDLVTSAQIGAVQYGQGEISLGPSSITGGTFVFPLNGKNFTVVVPASFDSSINGQVIATGQTFALNVQPGTLTLTFDAQTCGGGPCYFFNNAIFVTTPEPEPLLLFTTGVICMTVAAWRRQVWAGRVR